MGVSVWGMCMYCGVYAHGVCVCVGMSVHWSTQQEGTMRDGIKRQLNPSLAL